MSRFARDSVLLTAAITTAITLIPAAVALATNANNSWIGPAPANSTVGGNWSTGGYWSQGYVPGANSANADYVTVNNAGTLAYTVTAGAGVTDNQNIQSIYLNAGNQVAAKGPVSLTITNGGYIQTQQYSALFLSDSGYDATLTISGGTAASSTLNLSGSGQYGFANIGDGVSAGNNYQVGTATVNVDNGGNLLNSRGYVVGNQSNGVINLAAGGSITTWFAGSLTLGASAPNANAPAGGTGTVNQTGGTFGVGRAVTIGDNAAGVYNLSGGSFNITNGGSNIAYVGVNAPGSLNVDGGTANLAGLDIGGDAGTSTNHPNGLVTVRSGTLNTGLNFQGPGQGIPGVIIGGSDGQGSGKLVVSGSQGSLNFTSAPGCAPLRMYSNGTLDFQIGTNGKVSTIDAAYSSAGTQNDTRATIGLSGTLEIDLPTGFTPANGTVYTLLSTNVVNSTNNNGGVQTITPGIIITAGTGVYDGSTLLFTNTGLALSSVDNPANWSLSVVTAGSGSTETTLLDATYTATPEPSALALLTAAGAGILLLGRRKKWA